MFIIQHNKLWGSWRDCPFNSHKNGNAIFFRYIFSQNLAFTNFHSFVRDAVRAITHSWSQYWSYMLKLQLTAIWRMWSNQWTHLQLCHRNPDTLRRARHIAKLNCHIQPNYGDVGTHATCGTGSLWEIFNTQEQNCSSFQTNYDSCKFWKQG